MTTNALDPRSVCNAMLDAVPTDQVPPTNLSLQKLLYFAHGLYLVESKTPLVAGYFEAWKYGPVNPVAYAAFKTAGSNPIRFRATRQDPLTGTNVAVPVVENPNILRHLRRVMSTYGQMSPGQLVDVSHARGGPWHAAVESAEEQMAFGLRIADALISERFKYHKVSVGSSRAIGEPHEDTPFTRHRSR